MDLLPRDVLCLIVARIAEDAVSCRDVLPLGCVSRRWRAVLQHPFVWASWGGLEAARRATVIERNWAVPPPTNVPCTVRAGERRDNDAYFINDAVERVWLAENGRFALFLERLGSGRVLALYRSGICMRTWPLSGDFELKEVCIAVRGTSVAWISCRASQPLVRVLSCAAINRPTPFNVTVFRNKCVCVFHAYNA